MLLRAANELVETADLHPATRAECRDPRELLEVIYIVVGYRLVASIVFALQPERDDAGGGRPLSHSGPDR